MAARVRGRLERFIEYIAERARCGFVRAVAADLLNPPAADLAGMAGHKICRRTTVRLHAMNISFCEEVVADSEDRNI